MKVIILGLGNKVNGPNTWKEGLKLNLRKSGITVYEIDTSNIYALIKIIKILNCDILHTYHISPYSILLIFFGKLLRKKIILTIHGDIYYEQKSKKGLKKYFWIPLYEISIILSDYITLPSNYLLKIFIKKNPNLKKKLIVVYNGIESTKSYKQTNSKNNNIIRLLEVTSFNHEKKALGIVPLIESIDIIHRKNINVKLDILGDGKYFGLFKKKYSRKYVNFIGFNNPSKYLKKCDIFVHSTFLDNLPYVILEAMVFNKPIISVYTGGIPEILHKEQLVKPTKYELSSKLMELINDNYKLQRNILLNNKQIKKFLWINVVKDFIKIYE